MQHLSDLYRCADHGDFGAFPREGTDAHQPFRLQDFHHAPQMPVAHRFHPRAFGGINLVTSLQGSQR